MAERPADEISAEANILRDELRAAARLMGEAAGQAAQALDNATAFLRSDRSGPRTGAVRLQTPATPGAGVPVTTPAKRTLATLLREDDEIQP